MGLYTGRNQTDRDAAGNIVRTFDDATPSAPPFAPSLPGISAAPVEGLQAAAPAPTIDPMQGGMGAMAPDISNVVPFNVATPTAPLGSMANPTFPAAKAPVEGLKAAAPEPSAPEPTESQPLAPAFDYSKSKDVSTTKVDPMQTALQGFSQAGSGPTPSNTSGMNRY